MKLKIKNIVLALSMVLVLSSCKKGWLDVTSDTEIRSDEQFTSESGFKDALIGVYLGMTKTSSYSKDMTWNLVDILSRQYSPLISNSQYYDVYNFNYKSIKASAQIDAVWNNSYNVIANINNALDGIEKNKAVLAPISYSIIKGELLGLRAFIHFDLLRVYGHGNYANRPELASKFTIPYVSEFSKNITPQRTYAQTFELLIKDLTDAQELLKEDPIFNNPKKASSYYANVNRDGFYNKREQRMNYYAVKALQARVHLWMGGDNNLSKAALAAEEVIKDAPTQLISSINTVNADPSLYAEHLFNLNISGFLDVINPFLDAQNITNSNALFYSTQQAEANYETSNSNIGLADFRYNTLLSSQPRGLVSLKFLQKPASGAPGKNTMPLMRLPEMYYIAAESYSTVNPSKAVDYLNLVRNKRGITQNISPSATTVVLKAEIQKEYRKEFLMEGQLFFYYKRLGLSTFTGLATSIVADDLIYVLPYPNTEIEFGNRVQ